MDTDLGFRIENLNPFNPLSSIKIIEAQYRALDAYLGFRV